MAAWGGILRVIVSIVIIGNDLWLARERFDFGRSPKRGLADLSDRTNLYIIGKRRKTLRLQDGDIRRVNVGFDVSVSVRLSAHAEVRTVRS